MKRTSFLLPAFLVVAACLPTARAQIYVNGSLTTGDNDGSSWANAFRGDDALQSAITVAAGSGQIWVAAGTYYATTNHGATARTISFVLTGDVEIYGGFVGSETDVGDADPLANPTILSGEINNVHSNLDNSRQVVTTNSASSLSKLDGFTIRDGFNDGNTTVPDGAGIAISYGSIPKISRCTFTNNVALNGRGAGIFIQGDTNPLPDDNATISDCTITGNSGRQGAGFALANSSATIERCFIADNVATLQGGGGYVGDFSRARITDCTFSRNEAIYWGIAAEGGGVACLGVDSAPIFRKCQFTRNVVYGGNAGGASAASGPPTFILCGFTGNSCTLLSSVGFGLSGRAGGIWLHNGGRVLDCGFVYNSVRDDADEFTLAGRGGAIFASKYVPYPIVNSVFYWNSAERGGGLHAASGSEDPPDEHACNGLQVINCTFTQNGAATTGGGVEALGGTDDGAQTFTNCIFWNNSADDSTLNNNFHTAFTAPSPLVPHPAIPTYCCIEGGTGTYDSGPYIGNIFADPKFNCDGCLDALDLRLRPNSPCIDAANTPPVPADSFDVDLDTDAAEKTPDVAILKRVVDVPFVVDTGIEVDPESPEGCGVVDMGSFEAQPVCGTGVQGDMNGDGWVDALDVSIFANCYLYGDPYSLECACADSDHNGVINKLDTECFDSILVGSFPILCPWEIVCSEIGPGMMEAQSNQPEYDPSFIDARIDSFEAWRTANPKSAYPTMSQSVYDAWVRGMMISLVFPDFAS